MSGHVVATLMARESTRRNMTHPRPHGRAAAALRLQAWAHRLDSSLTAPPRARLQG
jgi:hypothetical protein